VSIYKIYVASGFVFLRLDLPAPMEIPLPVFQHRLAFPIPKMTSSSQMPDTPSRLSRTVGGMIGGNGLIQLIFPFENLWHLNWRSLRS
jgi:hypothetical protein